MESESRDKKKSAPTYKNIDESVKTYHDLRAYVDSMEFETNHQMVMAKELLEYGKLQKGEIAESLAYFNNKNTSDIDSVKDFFDASVYDDLLNLGFVTSDVDHSGILRYSLNMSLEKFQKIDLIDYLSDKIARYNEEHGIPENEFPNANNMGNIDWSHQNFKNMLISQKLGNSVETVQPAYWIWSVTSEVWKTVKSKNVLNSQSTTEIASSKINSGDQVAFYVIGTMSFKGIFEFDGEWLDCDIRSGDLESDGSIMYRSLIHLKPVQLGTAKISDLCKNTELFVGEPQNTDSIIFRNKYGCQLNDKKPVPKKDFEIIKQFLTKNPPCFKPATTQACVQNVIECPTCHTRIEEPSNVIFEYLVKEVFGYWKSKADGYQTKKPHIYCRVCRS